MKHTFTQELALRLRDKLSEPNGHRHSTIVTIYIYMIEMLILSDPEAFDWIYEVFVDEPGNWFYRFHKSLRQGETYMGYQYKTTPKKLTEEQKTRLNELRNMDITKDLPNYHELMEEQFALKEIWYDDGIKHIGGKLDMVLWEFIHLDNENILYDLMGNILSNILLIDPETKRCNGNLTLLSGDGEDGEGMDEPFFCRCDDCGEEGFYSVKTSNNGCRMMLDKVTVYSPNGYHWSKTENPEWEILHTKTI